MLIVAEGTICVLAQSSLLYGHGFGPATSLHISEGWYYYVQSSPVHGTATEDVPSAHRAHGASNCYIRFAVGPNGTTDVICCTS